MWGIELHRQSEISLVRQIYQKLSEQIINGRIKAGEALPSTRELAKQLVISRNTVCEAYEMLLTEGYVINRQGSPTRVAEGIHIEKKANELPEKKTINQLQPVLADFRTGQPDLRCFPRTLWNRIVGKTLEEMGLKQFGYTGPEGLETLRKEITGWLFRSRGLTVNYEDIFITAGATHALHLLAELLYEEGKEILVEDPCHIGMLHAMQRKGFSVCPIPVDEQGLKIEHLEGKDACALYLTPSHQFPLGGILPANRRAALIRFARENGVYIIEDDYDSEFRYCGKPIAPLYSMDPQQVIYVGTFSKILFPALRIGYVVLPQKLHKQWRYLRIHTDVQNPPFEQAALAEYIRTRKLDGHVKRMRKVYGERRQVLLQALEDTFGDTWKSYGDAAGLHIAIEFPGMIFNNEFMKNTKRFGINIKTVEYHSICKGTHLDKLLIGYGHLEPAEIRKGVLLLKEFIK